MKVMIVEDQTMIRSLLESYFRAEDGHQIVASISGAKQAVEVCRTTQVDLILMDVQTEHRENGLTAVRQIKAMHPEIVIVVVTSLIDGAVLEEAKAAGADSLWYKDSEKTASWRSSGRRWQGSTSSRMRRRRSRSEWQKARNLQRRS